MVESTAKGLGLEVNIKFDIHVLDYVHMSMKFMNVYQEVTNTSLTTQLVIIIVIHVSSN